MAHYNFPLRLSYTKIILRLSATQHTDPFEHAEEIFKVCQKETDNFYLAYGAKNTSDDARLVQRQAFALLWSKQFYYYDVDIWLNGDRLDRRPESHKQGRNGRGGILIMLISFRCLTPGNTWYGVDL